MVTLKKIVHTIYERFEYIGNRISDLEPNVIFGQSHNSKVYPEELLVEFIDKETSELIFLEVLISNNDNSFVVSSSLYVGESGDILSELKPIEINSKNRNLNKLIKFIDDSETLITLTLKAFRMEKPENLFNFLEKTFDLLYQKIKLEVLNVKYSGFASYDLGNIDKLWVGFYLPESKFIIKIYAPIKRTGKSWIIGAKLVNTENNELLSEFSSVEILPDENRKEYTLLLYNLSKFINECETKIIEFLKS